MNPDRVLDAIDLVIESLHRPDEDLRSQAHSMGCYDELMTVRLKVIKYLEQVRKNIKELNQDEE